MKQQVLIYMLYIIGSLCFLTGSTIGFFNLLKSGLR